MSSSTSVHSLPLIKHSQLRSAQVLAAQLWPARLNPRLLVLICALTTCSFLALSCSSSKSKKDTVNPVGNPVGNPVSEYDPEFDTPADEMADEPADETADIDAIPNLSEELELLDEAMQAYDKGLYNVAKTNFSNLQKKYPSSYYSSFAELKSADAEFQLGSYPEALESYQDFLRLRPKHEAVPYVMLQVAETYRLQYRGAANDQSPLRTAIKHYQSLIELYPSSSFSALGRRGIVACREQLALHESSVAKFYFKQGQKRSAAHRFKRLIGTYADTDPGKHAQKSVQRYFADEPELLQYITSRQIPVEKIPKLDDLQPSMPQGVVIQEDVPLQTELLGLVRNDPTADKPSADSPLVASDVNEGSVTKSLRPPAFLRMICNKSTDFHFVSLTLKNAPNYRVLSEVDNADSSAVTSNQNTLAILLQLDKDTTLKEGKVGELISNCSEGTLDANLSRRGDNELLLQVKYESGMKHRILKLDRPNRLVAVVTAE